MIDKHVFFKLLLSPFPSSFPFLFFFLLHVLLYKILSNNFIYVTKMFHTRWKSCVFFIFTTIKREQVYRTRVARKLVARGPTSWNHWTRLANLTRGGKIIPVLDSQDPTNLDSFPARVLVRTTWSRAKTPLWTLDKTYDSVKERKKKSSIFISRLPFTFTLVILFCLNNEKEIASKIFLQKYSDCSFVTD